MPRTTEILSQALIPRPLALQVNKSNVKPKSTDY